LRRPSVNSLARSKKLQWDSFPVIGYQRISRGPSHTPSVVGIDRRIFGIKGARRESTSQNSQYGRWRND
jgi:hypothetical protein